MTEILFRAWDKEKKEMVHDVIAYKGKPCKPLDCEIDFSNPLNILRGSELEQFVGIVDRSGNKIFECDIIEIPLPHTRIRCAVVRDGHLWGVEFNGSFNARLLPASGVEIVGNIHENSDLLEG